MTDRFALLTMGVCLACAGAGATAFAQTPSPPSTPTMSLTFDDALARAREQAARASAARVPLNDADARHALAARRLTSPPGVEAIVGGSSGSVGGTGAEITVTQMFDVGARRSARLAGAEASVASDRARADDLTRAWMREAALLFVRALHVRAREQLLMTAEDQAATFLDIAQRRFAAGDVAVLDVNVARAALAQARADRLVAVAERIDVIGQLRVRLGLTGEAPVTVDGRLEALLASRVTAPSVRGGDTLDRHPALAPLRAELAEAEAALAAARALTRPEVGAVAKYVRDQGTSTWLGGVALTLPIAATGREQHTIAVARVTRARDALELERRAIEQDVRTATDVHHARVEAARLLERDALPGLDENDALARRSYLAGELSLTDSLAIRRQALDMRLSYLDRLLDAVASGVAAQATAGALR